MSGVMGVDTDSFGFSWYRIAPHGGPRSGFFESPADTPDERRLEMLPEFTRVLMSNFRKGDWLLIEEPLALAKNGKTTRVLGLAAGALWAMTTTLDGIVAWADIA